MSFRSTQGVSAEGLGPAGDRPLAQDSVPIHADLVVFSHLRWNFVYQRPQHLMTRLARDRRVIFIEEPVHDESPEAWFEFERPEPNVLICRPHTPEWAAGFAPEQIDLMLPLLKSLRKEEVSDGCVVWFYTPMALPLMEVLSPAAVVYDCMDELSGFLNAPLELMAREKELFDRADVVFTGGASLYRAKRDFHPNVHCFPSSVDSDHFGRCVTSSKTTTTEKPRQAIRRCTDHVRRGCSPQETSREYKPEASGRRRRCRRHAPLARRTALGQDHHVLLLGQPVQGTRAGHLSAR